MPRKVLRGYPCSTHSNCVDAIEKGKLGNPEHAFCFRAIGAQTGLCMTKKSAESKMKKYIRDLERAAKIERDSREEELKAMFIARKRARSKFAVADEEEHVPLYPAPTKPTYSKIGRESVTVIKSPIDSVKTTVSGAGTKIVVDIPRSVINRIKIVIRCWEKGLQHYEMQHGSSEMRLNFIYDAIRILRTWGLRKKVTMKRLVLVDTNISWGQINFDYALDDFLKCNECNKAACLEASQAFSEIYIWMDNVGDALDDKDE